jgi:ABC-2 type transport system permease protein
MNDFNIIRVAVDDDVARRARPVVDRCEQQLARQQRIIDRLRFLSPTVLMQNALNEVAGTGSPRHRHFLDQVDRFHAPWRGFVVPRIFEKARITDAASASRFVYQEEDTAAIARRVLTGWLGLMIPAGLMTWIGLRRLRHFPVVA